MRFTTPTDLITYTQAAALVPSPVHGKQTHPDTIRGWVKAGRLRKWMVNGWPKVSEADVMQLLEPARVERLRPVYNRRLDEAETREAVKVLLAHGMKLPPELRSKPHGGGLA
jgi:hypothetical protein